jgi:peptidoglycan/LPS O-acetylase OafA/YrhL
VARILSSGFLVFLGNASYAMYILHAPITSWMRAFWKYVLVEIPEGGVFIACYAAAVVVVSSVVYEFYEEPLHRSLKKRLGARFAGTVTRPDEVRAAHA